MRHCITVGKSQTRRENDDMDEMIDRRLFDLERKNIEQDVKLSNQNDYLKNLDSAYRHSSEQIREQEKQINCLLRKVESLEYQVGFLREVTTVK